MSATTRRRFLKRSLSLGAAALAAGPLSRKLARAAEKRGSKMRLGLVTYLWGKDWDLPTVIANCEKADVLGVELRTEHAHGVERRHLLVPVGEREERLLFVREAGVL